jgi:homoserine O-acetyltransferase/O-succinyltransferase
MVEVQKRLIDRLGVERLLAVVGGSLGGHMVLDWARRFPDQLAGAAAIGTSPCLTSQALAFDIVGRNAILRDPEFQAGRYYGSGTGPTVGLALARMLGHITYLSREAMMQKFDTHRLDPHGVQTEFETRFSVGSYLAYQSDKFVDRFDANSYVALTLAMDLFNLGDTPQRLSEVLGASRCRWLLMSFSSDWLFPPFQSQEIVDALLAAHKPVSYCNVRTACGHDAFLLPNEVAVYGELVRAFLANLNGEANAAAADCEAEESALVPAGRGPASLFRQRPDYDSILKLIPPGASVLDLGCGTGGLLCQLRAGGHTRIMGVELDQQAILTCVRRGLDVIHADLNQGLGAFPNRQFDFVVLSQTLQAVTDVEQILNEMLRVGRRGIVSFPNLAYHQARRQLAEQGRAPQMGTPPGFSWYNTPNVRFFSIIDFEEFCRDRGICIQQQISLDTQSDQIVEDDPNRNADMAVFVLSSDL